jgi:hypothetical protein
MHLLKYAGQPDRRVWRAVAPDEIGAWREKAYAAPFNREGRIVTLEENRAAHFGWDQPSVSSDGVPVLERPPAERPAEGREVTEMLTRDILDQMLYWAKYDPELFREKIRLMKQTGHMTHLTDEEAARQVHDLCRKLAESDVQRVHTQLKVGGGWRGAVLLA